MHTLFIVFFLVSCGTANLKTKTDAGQETESHDPSPAPSIAPTEEYTAYAATAADMPTCKNSNQNELIYVADSQSFKYCNVGGWVDIKVAGKDGKDGSSAPDPINEKYLWKDPVTATLWILPGATNQYTPNTVCADPYREPSIAEASLAASRGLKLAAVSLNAPLTIWTNQSDTNGISEYVFDMSLSPMRSNSVLKTAPSGPYCMHK